MVHVAILAGSRKKSYIRKQPKCFVDMPTGECIVEEILREVDKVKPVEDVVIVGPAEGLRKLKDRNVRKRFNKKIYLAVQGSNIQENIVLAKEVLVKSLKLKPEKTKRLGLLYLFGDTPFRKASSIEEFISQIKAHEEADLLISFTPHETIHSYHRLFTKPLVPLFMDGKVLHMKESNMFYFNPDKMVPGLAAELYRKRHTSRLKNILALRKMILELGGRESLTILQVGVLVRQWHRIFGRFMPGWFHSPRFLYRKLNKDNLTRLCHRILGVRADIVLSSYPDGYIDVDSLKDYRKIYKQYFELLALVTRDCRKRA